MSDRLTLAHAFEDAGFDREKAEHVATTVYDTIRGEVARKADLEALELRIRSDVRMLTWQVRLLGSGMMVIGLPSLWLLLRVAAKVGALPGG